MTVVTWVLVCFHAGLLLVIVGNLAYLRLRRRTTPQTFPPVSVLIPARNEEANVRRLLSSLLAQDYSAFQLIVYDDGSEDRTRAILESIDDPRLTVLCGDGPPAGWVGKVHALYQASRRAEGELYLFLDADVELNDAEALRRLVEGYDALPDQSVLTGLTRLCGGGKLLVSLIPSTMLGWLPWPLVHRLKTPTLGALNGQCWLIDAETYHRYEPHRHLSDAVLEDVQIGRYLKREGITPYLVDVQGEVAVYMYRSIGDAWRGFRKNAYLMLGGTPGRFVVLYLLFFGVYVAAPFVSSWLLLSLYGLKAISDRRTGFPWWVTTLAPLSFVLGSILQLDSAISHLTGQVSWKGRRMGSS